MNRQGRHELTGRAVLLWFIGFFAVIFAVNAVLVQAATTTFRGMETNSSYKAGLIFKADIESAQRQDALRWHVGGTLTRSKVGEAVLSIDARDDKGVPLTGLTAAGRLAHPADAKLDRTMDLAALGSGAFRGVVGVQPGQWELIVDLFKGGQRVFRSQNRVILK